MGLISAARDAGKGVLSDQWREYFYCESMPNSVLMTKASKRNAKNNKGNDNVISNGSIVAINEGQCMIIVSQGQVVEVCAEPGEFVYDTSSQPSVFYGDLGESIVASFKEFGKRFAFGGSVPTDQRVYFVNTKDILGNKYGTPNPVPFRIVDQNIGLDFDAGLKCHGEFSYRIIDPVLFYKNIAGNVQGEYTRNMIEGQLKTELLTALQPAFAKISEMGIRYSSLPAHTEEISSALHDVLSDKWDDVYGITIGSFGVSSVIINAEDEKMIKELQRAGALRNPNMAAATLASAQAQAMQDAAKNTATGPMMAFAGMNMAQQAGGINAQQLFEMGAQATSAQPAADQWTCACGHVNRGKFCSECGAPKPAQNWTCKCGTVNTGKFCTNCGSPKA